MEKLKPLLPFVLLLFVAIPVALWLYPQADPYGGIVTHVDAEGAANQGLRVLDSLSVDVSGLVPSEEFRFNRPLVRQLQETYGLAESNRKLRSDVPGYVWEVRWRTEKPISFSLGEENSSERTQEMVDQLKGEVSLQLTMDGGLLSLERKIPDSAKIATLPVDSARQLAVSVLRRFYPMRSGIDFDSLRSEKTIVQPRRSDFEFVWTAPVPELPNRAEVKVVVAGSVLASIDTDFKVPEQFSKFSSQSLVEILSVVLIGILIITMVVIAFRRFRSFELGFKTAFIVAIVTAVVVGIEIFVSTRGVGLEILLPLIFGPLFIGGGLLIVWAVSESIGRDAWNDKFVSVDLLTKGHLVHSRVGAGVVRGIGLGAAALAVSYLAISVAGRWWHVGQIAGESTVRMLQVSTPALLILAHDFYSTIFLFSLFVVFAVSVLRRRIDSPVLLVGACALIFGLVRQGDMSPLGIGIVIQTIIAAIAVWAFYRYDLLTAFLTLYMMEVFRDAVALAGVGHPSFALSGYMLLGLAGVLVLVSLGVQFRKREIADFESISPAFVKHITERQRLQQELEIARQVQMSFLPKTDPVVKGLEIASRCVPALEVGGDYYDFISFGPHKLGIAIGDVSGKGTQAAFYMTLAKGFLRALSQSNNSVSEVLKKINALFYQNVERGSFISMVYAVFDVGRKNARLTRAGHNPVLVWKAKEKKLQVIQPDGLALGLEDGKKFGKTIEEVRIAFRKGDCFVFYTDGFTEAMNKQQEEYGDDRFADTVKAHLQRPAKEMVDAILKDLRVFIGKAKQHDDMTIVVVKAV